MPQTIELRLVALVFELTRLRAVLSTNVIELQKCRNAIDCNSAPAATRNEFRLAANIILDCREEFLDIARTGKIFTIHDSRAVLSAKGRTRVIRAISKVIRSGAVYLDLDLIQMIRREENALAKGLLTLFELTKSLSQTVSEYRCHVSRGDLFCPESRLLVN